NAVANLSNTGTLTIEANAHATANNVASATAYVEGGITEWAHATGGGDATVSATNSGTINVAANATATGHITANAYANAYSGFSQYATVFIPDRKSTRLNSSHVEISYAVFCLKKKTAKKYNA